MIINVLYNEIYIYIYIYKLFIKIKKVTDNIINILKLARPTIKYTSYNNTVH